MLLCILQCKRYPSMRRNHLVQNINHAEILFYHFLNVSSARRISVCSVSVRYMVNTYLLNKVEKKKNSHTIPLVFIPKAQPSSFPSLDYISPFLFCSSLCLHGPPGCILLIFMYQGPESSKGSINLCFIN